MSLLLPALDSRITLKGLLGAGGMGEVYRAWDRALERPLAVKFVRGSDPKEADRLLLEARLQSRVEHPNVVSVFDTGTLDGRPCILFQLVEGRTLGDLEAGATWRTKVTLAAQAARGLGAAHRMGLVHRDIKPANILVEDTAEGPQARLSDFGLARDEEGGLTRSGLLMGTVDYMAPEQVTGASPVDSRSDIYGLGATLYAVLVGRAPFRSTPALTAAVPGLGDLEGPTPEGEERPGDLLRRLLEEEPRPLVSQVDGLPRDLGVVVAKAMEKEPAQRYPTAEAFAADLDRVLSGEPILARSLNLLERGGRWARRNPLPARVLGVGLLALLVAGAFAGWNSRRATLETLSAAQLGGEAKALELRLKMAHLAPPHDLRPMKAELRAGLARLAAHRGPGSAAADYARGKVHFLLDELEASLAALESAEAKGFRGPELDEALGFVYGRRYLRALPAVEGLKDPELRAQRRQALDKELKAPALEHLGLAGNTLHQRAFMALVEKRFPEARNLARQSRAEDPERFESTLLELQAWAQEGSEAHLESDHAKTKACVEAGLRVGEALLADLRSDPEVPLLMAHFKDMEASTELWQGRPIKAPFLAGLAWADRALALDPDWAEAWKVRGILLEAGAKESSLVGGVKGISLGQLQVEASRRAVALRPRDADALRALAKALYTLGHAKSLSQQDPLESLREGRSSALAAEQLEPWHPSGPHLAVVNSLDEARYLLVHNQDPAEPLGVAEGLLNRLKSMRGISFRFVGPNHADLRSLQAQDAWNHGRDPDALQADGHAQYEALLAQEPTRLNRTTDLGYSAVAWAQARLASGRSVSEVAKRVAPGLEAGLSRWPGQSLLLYYQAWLKALALFDGQMGQTRARDEASFREALVAFSLAQAAMKNPGVLEIRAWIHLARAEAGIAEAAPKACADFQAVIKLDPGSRDPRLGLARALRRRGRPGDLALALVALQPLQTAAGDDAELALHRALLLSDQGRTQEAQQLKAQALARQPLLGGHAILGFIARP
ncbi:MAG: serine/threonine protein kinase [Holophagaceae bacterium]|nr:serine/threonine protein kinase [Holophagaceae bacterium]